MQSKKIIFACLASIFLFSYCHKCHDHELPAMLFSQQDLNINPYYEGDSILFISSTTDTLILYGHRRTENQVMMENLSSDEFALYGCRGQYYDWQRNYTSLRDDLKIRLEIFLYMPVIFENCWMEKSIIFHMSISGDSIYSFSGRYHFLNDSIFPSRCPYTNEIIEGYCDTVTIGPDTFFGVYKFYCNPSYYYQEKYPNWIQRIYYSISQGIVGFSLKNGQYYYLEKRF